MKTTTKILAGLLLVTSYLTTAQSKIELNFIRLDEKDKQVDKPEFSKPKDNLLAMELFDLESILKYEEVKCIVETNDFHVDEYTFPMVRVFKSQELFDGAEVSSSRKPGAKYKNLVLTLAPTDNNPDGEGEFSITATRNNASQSYIYSKEGNNDLKEYTLTARVVGINYKKVYNPTSDMYDIVPAHDPVLLSNVVKIKISTTDKLKKQALELTIGRKSDLFDAIKQGNEKTNELNGNGKSKKKD